MFGVAFSQLAILIFISLGGQSTVPLGMPPGPEDPIMAQFAPQKCLLYSTWSSTVTPDPSQNVTERWMAQPEIVATFDRLKLATRQMSQTGDAGEDAINQVAFKLAERCLSQSVGFYVSKIKFDDFTLSVEGGALIDLGSNARELMSEITLAMKDLAIGEGITIGAANYSGLDCWTISADQTALKSTLTWGLIRDQYLAITMGDGEMQRLLGNLLTDAPQWLVEMRNDLPVARVSSVTRIDVSGCLDCFFDFLEEADPRSVEEIKEILKTLGISALRQVGWVSGLDNHGFICRGLYRIEGEPEGLMGLMAGEPLKPVAFGKIADQPMMMLGARISMSKTFQLLQNIYGMDDRSRRQFDQGVAWINETFGFNLQEDVIDHLDDYAYLYGSPNLADPRTGWVLGIGVANEMALIESYEKFNDLVRANCESIPSFDFIETDVSEHAVYSFKEQGGFSILPNLSWSLSDGELLFSFDVETLSSHLQREWMADNAMVKTEWFSRCFSPIAGNATGPLWVSSVNIPSLVEMGMPLIRASSDRFLPTELDFELSDLPSTEILTKGMKPSLSALYQTPAGFETIQRQTYPGGTPGSVVGAAAIGVLPALMKIRKAAARTQAGNQIRQLILAMHQYHDVHGALPARFSQSADGKPLLSWRVHILPCLGEDELYREFHLDEPWNSEHNRTLIDRMPDVFRHPKLKTGKGKTVYLVSATNGVIRSPQDSVDETDSPIGMKLPAIIDGTSRTGIVFVGDANNSVNWTQPKDFQWEDLEDPVNELYDGWGDCMPVGFADGSVHFVKASSLRKIFGNLIQPDDGEVVMFDRD